MQSFYLSSAYILEENTTQTHEFYFSVIIATHNRREILAQTLDALENQSIPRELYEVIVVNDGSEDDTADFLERYKNRARVHFTYINKENEGQGIARNTGFQVSDGHVIVFMNDDMIPDPDCLSEHKKVHDKFATSNFMCLGYATWHPDIEITPYMLFLEESGMQFKYSALDKARLVDPELGLTEASYPYFYTCNLSLKRPLFERFQFNESFKKYGWEDVELGYRLQEAGSVLLYNKSSKVWHHHVIREEDMEKRMKQIGKSARKAHKIQPKITIVPGLFKKLVFSIIGSGMVVNFLKSRWDKEDKKTLTNAGRMYYYAAMKRYFLYGLQGKK